MDWNIQIGTYTLAMMERVGITRSVEKLADVAEIVMPGTVYNKTLEIEDKIKRGDKVLIELGYDNNLVNEFEGYVDLIKTDGSSLTIMCEDALFLYRTDLKDVVLQNPSLQDILAYVHKTITGFELNCSYDFSYDSFTISSASGYDVLKKIQEETKANIYVKGNTLHVHPQYIEIFGEAIYDFAVNIDKNDTDLTYKSADERKLLVIVEGKDSSGKTFKIEEGTTGGDKLRLEISGVSNEASLRRMAKQAHEERVFTGYDGTFTSWLIPYVDAGYKIKIRDADYEYKNGAYYVLEVRIEFDKNGGKRINKLGKQL